MNLEERVTDLESRLAFQDDTIQALNDELVAQQRVIERLQLQMAACSSVRKRWSGSSTLSRKKRHRRITDANTFVQA
jgi:uncharacterized coiled-coil protein SlyX